MYGCRDCDYDLCPDCYSNMNEFHKDNTFKGIIFPLFPHLKHIVMITTGFAHKEYFEYPVNIAHLTQWLANRTNIKIIRGP